MMNASHNPNRSLVHIFCLSLGGFSTHDANIAASFPRQIHMRDGEIVGDERS